MTDYPALPNTKVPPQQKGTRHHNHAVYQTFCKSKLCMQQASPFIVTLRRAFRSRASHTILDKAQICTRQESMGRTHHPSNLCHGQIVYQAQSAPPPVRNICLEVVYQGFAAR